MALLPGRVTLRALKAHVLSQPEKLKELSASFGWKRARSGSLLIGSGDSFAASICASSLSLPRLIALDPSAIVWAPEVSQGRDVYFSSVSGRTIANVEAARKVRGVAKRVFVITADPRSPLAKEADDVLLLPFSVGGKAPGLLSFSLVLLSLVLLAVPSRRWDFDGALSASKSSAEAILLSRSGTTHFLGNQATLGVGVYAAAKVREFLGWRSAAQLIEEFSHMELFSLRKQDTVNIFRDLDPSSASRLHDLLRSKGFSASLLPSFGESPVESLYHLTFAAQISCLKRAEEERLVRPYFLGARDLLEISDAAIY